ncbi:hypothetical protein L6R52_07745 [Myxococcota bacterium]|nr:hypothetical protein [Myxococcota bacterium]
MAESAQSSRLSVQLVPGSGPAPVIPFVNKLILRRQGDSFFLEAYFVDDFELRRQLADAGPPGPSELPAVELPYVVKLAVAPSAIAELVRTAQPFWERALSDVARESEALADEEAR